VSFYRGRRVGERQEREQWPSVAISAIMVVAITMTVTGPEKRGLGRRGRRGVGAEERENRRRRRSIGARLGRTSNDRGSRGVDSGASGREEEAGGQAGLPVSEGGDQVTWAA
jgi:hypothetical protein